MLKNPLTPVNGVPEWRANFKNFITGLSTYFKDDVEISGDWNILVLKKDNFITRISIQDYEYDNKT
jgi:hypothetical protein